MKKVGISSKSNLQGDSLIINYGETASISFNFEGSSSLTFSLPQADGTAGLALITDGNGNLSFGTVSSAGNVQVIAGETPKIAYFTGTYSIGNSELRQGTNGNLLFPSGSTAAPGVSFYLDDDTGMMRTADNEVAIVTGTTQSAIFKSDGVQIGDVTYTRGAGVDGSILSIDSSGNTQWIPNSGATGATGPTGATGATGPQGATGSFEGTYIELQSGTFSGDDMIQGPPLYYDVVFPTAFLTNYIVNIESDTPRDWSITNKTSTGFRVDSNSSTAITDIISWQAQELVSDQIGAFIGATGPEGPIGATGATGSDGLNAPPSVAGDFNTSLIGGTTDTDRFIHFRRGGGTPAGDAGVVFSNYSGQSFYQFANGAQLDFRYSSPIIGTTSVRDNTDLLLRIYQDGQVRFVDGSAATPSISFAADTNTGIYRPGNDELSITTAGVERFRVKDDFKYYFNNNVMRLDQLSSSVVQLQIGATETANSGTTFRISPYFSSTPLVDFDTANLETDFYGRTYFVGGVAHEPIVEASVSGTYTLDMEDANVWDLTLTGDTTLTYTNEYAGSYIVRIKQDGVGGRSLAFAADKFIAPEGLTPAISTGSGDLTLLQLIYIDNRAIVVSIENLSAI